MATVQAKLEKLRREVRAEWRRPTRARWASLPRESRVRDVVTAATLGLLKVLTIVALPFIVYVRASVFFYTHGAPAWLAILGGAALTAGLMTLYSAWISRRFHGRARAAALSRWIALPLAIAWSVYALFYLARVNAKSDAIHSYYMSVHPVLRVALSTVILVDPKLVITDMARTPEDYPRMGLPVNDRTKHYRQRDGWVHAVDLRTKERGEIANRMIQFYFWIMGFSTLRHVGTADHLHVQLRTRP
jgi:multisubunit Na+/H+ antiporter MnhB subunit